MRCIDPTVVEPACVNATAAASTCRTPQTVVPACVTPCDPVPEETPPDPVGWVIIGSWSIFEFGVNYTLEFHAHTRLNTDTEPDSIRCRMRVYMPRPLTLGSAVRVYGRIPLDVAIPPVTFLPNQPVHEERFNVYELGDTVTCPEFHLYPGQEMWYIYGTSTGGQIVESEVLRVAAYLPTGPVFEETE